ncbi:hypothetical protein MTO96_031451 [Rhipicephalus appendiculatus]
MDDLEAASNVPLPEDMELQHPGDARTSPDALTLTPTAANAPTAIATLRRAPLRPDVNPFDVLADPETPKDGKGKFNDLLASNVLILPTSKHGQKRARGARHLRWLQRQQLKPSPRSAIASRAVVATTQQILTRMTQTRKLFTMMTAIKETGRKFPINAADRRTNRGTRVTNAALHTHTL